MPDLLAAHEADVERTGGRDGSKRRQAAEKKARGGREAAQARDKGVEPHGDGAGGRDGSGVGLGQDGVGLRGGFVSIGIVDGDIERLVGDLPEKRARGLGQSVNRISIS